MSKPNKEKILKNPSLAIARERELLKELGIEIDLTGKPVKEEKEDKPKGKEKVGV